MQDIVANSWLEIQSKLHVRNRGAHLQNIAKLICLTVEYYFASTSSILHTFRSRYFITIFGYAGCIPNPTSRSTVVLNSTDAFDPPKVDLNILGESEEAEGLLSCLDREREVVAQMPASFGMNETSSSVTVEEVFAPF